MVRPWKLLQALAVLAAAMPPRTGGGPVLATMTPAGSSSRSSSSSSRNGTATAARPKKTTEPPAWCTTTLTVKAPLVTYTSTTWATELVIGSGRPTLSQCYDSWDLCHGQCLIFAWFTFGIPCCRFALSLFVLVAPSPRPRTRAPWFPGCELTELLLTFVIIKGDCLEKKDCLLS
ncbi:hypothetical protein GGTG_09963 [Gaeumannomyces tritici R3-111a-1]|uniref:Uncharacterized protein n=1 Tax=Gaeumannomyces tritici (strain R3-111a-1) TaxID=644352 RepID=J3P8X8_GAET3|nr:hypothetical protein GGTG_09963 [Gaeumannomyces tritici R3-111a-1]EJT73113.1 hypothetical protein GGTG_09963 [Gaeumannomyces tritici R3-111a-1]